MLTGAGRYGIRDGEFAVRASADSSTALRRVGAASPRSRETAATGLPSNTNIRSFAKPTGVGINVGLISNDPHQVIIMAREMYDNDPVCGAVVDTVANIPFGNFSLSGISRAMERPHLQSLDRIRAKSLMPVLTTSHLVDGAFLGSGVFDERAKVWDAIIPQNLLYAQVTPVPFFGATPVVDVQVHRDAASQLRSTDPRMQRYLKHLPPEFLRGGVVQLQPENTFYIPHKAMSHTPLGTSLYRKVMIIYVLERALMRGTIEMSYRRQRPMTHMVLGDENWDPSIQEMRDTVDLFQAADLDPLGAFVATRQGVSLQELGGVGEMWKWTDVSDQLASTKLKGMGMPDGLLGGDVALDSVSATLTVFINQTRQLRDSITRAFMYEKLFPYVAVTNGHRKEGVDDYRATAASGFRANDLDVDLEDYATPTISWHNSMRPEGDKEYIDLLQTLTQLGVPIPIRMLAAAGGMDINDILNDEAADIATRTKVAEYVAQVTGITQASTGGDDQQGGDQQSYASLHDRLSPIRRRGLASRKFDDSLEPRTSINGHAYVTTARERKRRNERNNRVIAEAAASVARRVNHASRRESSEATGEVYSL